MKRILLGLGIGLSTTVIAWVVAPQEKVIYKDKPSIGASWCKMPLAVGAKGSAINGDYSGMPGVIAGKINNNSNCAYYVKYNNCKIWKGCVHYQSINASNFVETKL